MELKDRLDRLSLDDLSGEQRELAEIVGIDKYKQLVKIFGGTFIRIHEASTVTKAIRDAEIYEKYNGKNARELAVEYGLSDKSIYNIVKAQEAQYIDQTQMKLF